MNWSNYLFQFGWISIIATLVYWILLVKAPKLNWNRFILLAISAGSLIFPFIRITTSAPWRSGKLAETLLDPVIIRANQLVEEPAGSGTVIIVGYLLISICLFFLWSYRFFRLLRFKRSCGQAIMLQGTSVYLTEGHLGTSSFGPWIFWDNSQQIPEPDIQLMLLHERCHQQQGHTYDLMWIDFLTILFWWNPAMYLLRQFMMANHEAIADRFAMRIGRQEAYKNLLLQQWIRGKSPLAHHFHFSHTKHRISMIQLHSSLSVSNWKYAVASPIFFLLIYLGTCEAQDTIRVIQETQTSSYSGYTDSGGTDVPPVILNLNQVKMEIGYPVEARKNGEKGQILVKVFVNQEGLYESHEILESASDLLKEAVEENLSKLRFQPSTLQGNPTSFWVTIPFNFVLLN